MPSDGPPSDGALLAALGSIRVRGAIGEASLEWAITHSEQFVSALPSALPMLGTSTLVDLGSGGGLPGLVIALRRPDLSVTLVERRQSRADLLSRAVRALKLSDRVTVLAEDIRLVASRLPASFDVVTARSFAAPAITMQWAGALLRPGGVLVVSEPPDDFAGRWDPAGLEAAGLVDLGREQGVRRFSRI